MIAATRRRPKKTEIPLRLMDDAVIVALDA